MVIRHSSFVICLMSYVLCKVGAGLVKSGCNQKDSSETRPYRIPLI
ncbi:hypothetical protein MC7420_6293 [Coleofasciculus chthonoplastes PCC 7420]|uniref:Uncharacterized protein n=1 Tax=Coleofasciculus chthonoplastes PCC 7420 TaxID=118168 RepID=B4VQM5_9CYAN|nr:hypothetical protein MC7420_6293 [Coleofasciculus chthonoplastes PCC 7420]